MMAKMWQVNFLVNGKAVTVRVDPLTRLSDILREELGLVGTKVGCNEGECGACTVMMNRRAVNSCLVLAPQAEGADIWTIEGIGSENELHRVQEAFLEEGAVQCGYCTPGMILSAVALLDEKPDPSEDEIKEAIAGNLCRCTGYQKIVRAIQRCAEEGVKT